MSFGRWKKDPGRPPAKAVVEFGRGLQEAARKRRRAELRRLLRQVNRLREELGLPAWEKAIAFPNGLRYYYLSKSQLAKRRLREELARLRAMRKRAA